MKEPRRGLPRHSCPHSMLGAEGTPWTDGETEAHRGRSCPRSHSESASFPRTTCLSSSGWGRPRGSRAQCCCPHPTPCLARECSVRPGQLQGVSRPRNTFNEWLRELELVATSTNESRGLTLSPLGKGWGDEVMLGLGREGFSWVFSLPARLGPYPGQPCVCSKLLSLWGPCLCGTCSHYPHPQMARLKAYGSLR